MHAEHNRLDDRSREPQSRTLPGQRPELLPRFERIVAKAAVTVKIIENFTFDNAANNKQNFALACQRNHANEPALACCLAPHIGKQSFIIFRICCLLAGVAGGVYSRVAVQGVYFKPRVVCKNNLCGVLRIVNGFSPRVLFKGIALFGRACNPGKAQ